MNQDHHVQGCPEVLPCHVGPCRARLRGTLSLKCEDVWNSELMPNERGNMSVQSSHYIVRCSQSWLH